MNERLTDHVELMLALLMSNEKQNELKFVIDKKVYFCICVTKR